MNGMAARAAAMMNIHEGVTFGARVEEIRMTTKAIRHINTTEMRSIESNRRWNKESEELHRGHSRGHSPRNSLSGRRHGEYVALAARPILEHSFPTFSGCDCILCAMAKSASCTKQLTTERISSTTSQACSESNAGCSSSGRDGSRYGSLPWSTTTYCIVSRHPATEGLAPADYTKWECIAERIDTRKLTSSTLIENAQLSTTRQKPLKKSFPIPISASATGQNMDATAG